VLSGELIVFQNEMLEIFKEMIDNSPFPITGSGAKSDQQIAVKPLQPRYIISMILEFLRTLLENQIPQQPSQQHLLVKYILMTKDTQTLHSLLQYQVLSNSLELARILINLGSSESKRTIGDTSSFAIYYEPAYQLGLDMLKKIKSNEDVVYALLAEGLVLRALDYAQE